MRNPFRRSNDHKRGLPDSTMIPVSSSVPPANIPANFPSSNMVPAGYTQNNPTPPIAYPYAPQPDEGESGGQVWEFNTGENKNMKGHQIGGHIKVGNTVGGSSTGISFPQNGRFVFNTGKNYNHGDVQENGNIEFGNVY